MTTQDPAPVAAAGPRRLGTGLDAINHALQLDDRADVVLFLEHWRAGDLSAWPTFRPMPRPLTATELVIRAAAIFGGLFAGLMLFVTLADAAFSPTPGDPVQACLSLLWAGAGLVCAIAAWRRTERA